MATQKKSAISDFSRQVFTLASQWAETRLIFDQTFASIICDTSAEGQAVIRVRDRLFDGSLSQDEALSKLKTLSNTESGALSLAIASAGWKEICSETQTQSIDEFIELVDKQLKALGNKAPSVQIKRR